MDVPCDEKRSSVSKVKKRPNSDSHAQIKIDTNQSFTFQVHIKAHKSPVTIGVQTNPFSFKAHGTVNEYSTPLP